MLKFFSNAKTFVKILKLRDILIDSILILIFLNTFAQ